MPIWPFQRSRAHTDAARLLTTVLMASRRPALFGDGRVPDTLEGRFEMVTLHAALALVRLRADPGVEVLAQNFTDQLFRHFDAGLRESGVGDLTVPKKMRKLAGDFYGRLEAYGAALAAVDAAALGAAISRNVFGDETTPFASALAKATLETARSQGGAPLEALFEAGAWGGAPSV